jgi:hypothetical protein
MEVPCSFPLGFLNHMPYTLELPENNRILHQNKLMMNGAMTKKKI